MADFVARGVLCISRNKPGTAQQVRLSCMEDKVRVENPIVSHTLTELSKTIDKERVNSTRSIREDGAEDEMPSSAPLPFRSGKTYSPMSLRAAVDYHAKFLTVVQNNLEAVNHPAAIPRELLDRLNAR